jgi:hypothetical protein
MGMDWDFFMPVGSSLERTVTNSSNNMINQLKNARCHLAAVGLLAVGCLSSSAQPITPAWEYLISKLPAPLPILTNYLGYTTDLENGDGLSLMDCIGPMRRYDTNRLLLGIRENGIDESGASGAYNTNLALAYPDRSLIWINPTNGFPLGLALTMGLTPVPLDPSLAAAGGTPGQYYWSFDVSEDGYVYSGYKNQIIRYAPNGTGGISPTPTVIFTLDQATAVANGVPEAQWPTFRWQHIRVRGSGPDTKLLVGGGGARGAWLLTTDGTTFTAGAHMTGGFGNAAGNLSNFIPDPTGTSPEDIAFYGGSYPNNSSGSDTLFYKAKASPPFTDPANLFTTDSSFIARPDPNTNNLTRYQALFSGSCDVHPDLDFIVHYSTPPYNPTAVGGDKPGWLAIHDRTNGNFMASYQLAVSGAAEFLPDDNSPLFIGCIGSVSLYPLPDGTAEVLWTSEIYGYGRYIIGTPRYAKAYAMSKVVKPIWEQLQGSSNLLPIIDTDVNPNPVPSDGSSVMHVFTGLKKYDSNRLLLGIRDNGINEKATHNTNLASAFPDRSLQWLDAETGAPLGTALVVTYPAGTIGDDNHLNMGFGLSEDGVLYLGVGDTIQRYAPSGSGFAAPTIAFTAPAGTPQPTKIQFGEFRVTGSGASTVIVAGNRDWYGNVDRILTTTDGVTFTEVTAIPTGAGSGGGGLSSVVPAADNVDDRVIFRTSYPSTSNGVDSRIHRRRQVGATGDFIADTYNPEQVPGSEVTNSTDVIYRTLFLTDAQTLPGLPYVVAYSTPSFRTFDNPTVQSVLKASSPEDMPYQPGWLALHGADQGEVLGLRKLKVTEALNVIPATTSPPIDFYTGWFVYAIPQGGVELYPVLNSVGETAGVEILWWSATYGMGRYYVDTAPPALRLRGSKTAEGLRFDWNGAGVLQSAVTVEGPYTDVIAATTGYTYAGQEPRFFRLRLMAP